MMKLLVIFTFAGFIGAVAEDESGYPVPAPPAIFYDTSVTADASGVTLLSIYFEGDGRAMWETEPLVSYMIFPSNEGSTAPGFTFDFAKPIEKDYQIRFTSLSVLVGDIVLPIDYEETDLFEGNLEKANVVKDGGKVVFIPTKVPSPEKTTLQIQYEAEYMGDSVYRVFAEGTIKIDFPSSLFQ